MDEFSSEMREEIAIVGMACRLPGARNVEEFWRNLRGGVESIRKLSREELLAAGVSEADLAKPNFVSSAATLDDAELFDAGFFGYMPREAEIIDPQQRVFLECCYSALEDGGYDPERTTGNVGVFGGVARNTYLVHNVLPHPEHANTTGLSPLWLGNDKDFVATRVSHKLNLKGPAFTVQTACSTSGVAIHLACQSLLAGECDLALAGGARIQVPLNAGYLHTDGGILSRDGHCRAFDADASGTIAGSGCGVVLLKRLSDALRDGDNIHAVIKAAAINNDGSAKAGFTAPSVSGQAAVVAEAHALAEVDPETIGYIEAHGTATAIGDPIEVAALTQAFKKRTRKTGFCAIGSVKSNIGHLDAGAGAAGVIKAALCLKHRQLPPSLHYKSPNPQIDFASSPFYVNDALREWVPADHRRGAVSAPSAVGNGVASNRGAGVPPAFSVGEARCAEARDESAHSLMTTRNPTTEAGETPAPRTGAAHNPTAETGETPAPRTNATPAHRSPLRAGVSSFGLGGTNAHIILEEAPSPEPSETMRPWQTLLLSAKSSGALETLSRNLAAHLKAHPELTLADVAYTLQNGRRVMEHRRAVACGSLEQAARLLEHSDAKFCSSGSASGSPPVAFMFPGGGAQYPSMGAGLYASEPQYREAVDECLAIAKDEQKLDLQRYFDGSADASKAALELERPSLGLPALFISEYSLARIWMAWGITPVAMIGHSMGEYTAACISGVLSLRDALAMVALRGRLFEKVPAGAMLSVPLSESEASTLAIGGVSIAAINGPQQCVLAGPVDSIAAAENSLKARGTEYVRVRISVAAHSPMLDSILPEFAAFVKTIALREPTVPYVSNVSGDWITPKEARDPEYFVRHLRQTVRFSQGLRTLFGRGASHSPTADGGGTSPRRSDLALLECGPGKMLCSLAGQDPELGKDVLAVSTLRHPKDSIADPQHLAHAIGKLWTRGVSIDFAAMHRHERRMRVSLPGYPFERKRCWIDPPRSLLVPKPEIIHTNQEKDTAMKQEIARPSRTQQIETRIKEILSELSGIAATDLASDANFFELGFDSLFLTRATQAFAQKFGVKITFRQLLEQYSSIAALAVHLDATLPAEMFREEDRHGAVSAPSAVGETRGTETRSESADFFKAMHNPTADGLGTSPRRDETGETPALREFDEWRDAQPLVSGSSVEQIVQQQLQLMAQQLQLLRGGHAGADNGSGGARVPATRVGKASNSRASAAPGSGNGNGHVLHPTAEAGETPAPRNNAPLTHGPYMPLNKNRESQLTSAQKTYVDELIARYTKKTTSSKRLAQENRRRVADPRAISGFRALWKEMVYPIVARRTAGSKMWDVDGNEYIDLIMGYGISLFGNSPPFIDHAISEQIKAGYAIGPSWELAGRVAELFCELTGAERITFCNTGSEAVMAAMRVARTVTGRSKIVFFADSYHGVFDEVLVRTSGPKGKPVPVAPGIPLHSGNEVMVLEYGNPSSLETIRQHADQIAAVLVEPVQSKHPDLQPREFLQRLRELTNEKEIALVFDEMITGFRIHPGGAQAHFGVKADIAAYGKVAGGGMPIGVLAGKSRFMDALDGGAWNYGDASAPEATITYFAGTFVRHPFALAAAHAALTHLKRNGPSLQQNLNSRATRLVDALNTHFDERENGLQILSFGSVFKLIVPSDAPLANVIFFALREKGIDTWERRNCFLSTAHSDQDIEKIIAAYGQAADELQDAGFLPSPDGGGLALAGAGTEKKNVADVSGCQNRGAGVSPASAVGETRRAETSDETADCLRAAHNPTAETGETPAPRTSSAPTLRTEKAPLTQGQREIWLACQMSPEASCAYNESTTLRLRGALDARRLSTALDELARRHEALRTTFAPDGQEQVIAENSTFKLTICDLSRESEAVRNERITRTLEAEPRTPFNLESGPLWRGTLFRLATDDHLLVLSFHHVIVDGWSIGTLIEELSAIYTAGAGAKLKAPLSIRKFDAARAVDPAHENWWLERLTPPPPVLELPLDAVRPAFKTFGASVERALLKPETCARLKAFCGKRRATLFTTLLATWQTLLHRLTGQDDVVVGIAAAGQSQAEGCSLVGHCVNMLPIRSRLDQGMSFDKLLEQTRTFMLDAFERQDVTFSSLLPRLKLQRDFSRTPLIEAAFNFERVERGSFEGLDAEIHPLPKQFFNFDLFLNVRQDEAALELVCCYNRDLLHADTIRRWLHHFETILCEAMEHSDREARRLSLISQSDWRMMATAMNATSVPLPDGTALELFEQRAKETPDAPAVSDSARALEYGELNTVAETLSAMLLDAGVRKGTRVATCFPRSVEQVVACVAIAKAGGVYLPIDPDYPAARIRFMLDDAAPLLVLTTRELKTRIGDARPVISVDIAELKARKAQRIDVRPSANDHAYVIYTSGSTGKPKGVPICHRSLLNLICWHVRTFQPSREDRTSLLAGPAFDASVWEIWSALCSGASLHIPGDHERHDVAALTRWMSRERLTHAFLPTPLAEAFLQQATLPTTLTLRVLFAGGDNLKIRPKPAMPFRVFNLYGPTECTIISTAAEVLPVPHDTPPDIGCAIDNTVVLVLDQDLQPVPIGVAGELFIGGAGLADGYINRPELDRERFIENPLLPERSAKLYRTGDLVRILPGGKLLCIGRADQQVKVRGYRVECGEIEAALREIDGIREAFVTPRKEAGVTALAAYVVTVGDTAIHERELRDKLKVRLPEYMIPSTVTRLERLPLTANGKIDRAALPPPESAASVLAATPMTDLESRIAAVWCDVLKRERIHQHEHFFAIGGHSLLAAQIASRLSRQFNVSLTLRSLFEAPTIAELASLIEASRKDAAPESAPIQRIDRNAELPLSFSQQRLWFMDQLDPNSTTFVVPCAVRLDGELNIGALERAFNEIVRRHEALRARFAAQDGRPVLSIAAPEIVRLAIEQLSGDADERMKQARRLATDEARIPFDIARGSLFRARLLQISEREHVLLFSVHHIVFDGWSLGVFLRELSGLYGAYSGGGHGLPPELAIQYVDVAAWQRKVLSGAYLERQLGYWRERLAAPPPPLNVGQAPHVRKEDFRGARHEMEIDAKTLERLRAVGLQENASLYMVVLAAYKLVLQRYGAQDDICVGTPVAGRQRPETEPLIGFFINTVVLRTNLSGAERFHEVLRRVRATVLGALAHQDVPFERVVQELQPQRAAGRSPYFNVFFNMLTETDGQIAPQHSAGVKFEIVTLCEHTESKFDLSLKATEHDGALQLTAIYNAALLDESFIATAMSQLRTLLETVAADPDRPLGALRNVPSDALNAFNQAFAE